MKTSLKKMPKSQVEIEIEISSDDFDEFWIKATSHLSQHLKVDGFRKGNVPESIVEERVGKENLLAEAAEMAVKDAYTKAVLEYKIEPISQPEVEILKLARGNPFLFRIKVAVLPEIVLGDYRKIASQVKKNKISVSEDEITDSLEYLRKSRAKFSQIERPAQEKDFVEIEYWSPQLSLGKEIYPVKSAEGGAKQFNWVKDEFILGQGGFIPGFEKNIVGMKKGEEKEFAVKFPENSQRKDLASRPAGRASPLAGKDVKFKVKVINIQKVELPDLNDEFAGALGKFANLDHLKKSVGESITSEKESQEKQRQRNEVIEKVAEKSKFEVPEVLINLEQERLLKNFQDKISQNFKISFQDYLASIKQDEKTVKESFLKEAEKKVKNYLILKEIGKKEGISATDEEVELEVNNTMKNYPIEVAKKIDIKELKNYTKSVICNEKIFQLLEKFSR